MLAVVDFIAKEVTVLCSMGASNDMVGNQLARLVLEFLDAVQEHGVESLAVDDVVELLSDSDDGAAAGGPTQSTVATKSAVDPKKQPKTKPPKRDFKNFAVIHSGKVGVNGKGPCSLLQGNESDCGVIVCIQAVLASLSYIERGTTMTFAELTGAKNTMMTNEALSEWRRRLVDDIYQGTLKKSLTELDAVLKIISVGLADCK